MNSKFTDLVGKEVADLSNFLTPDKVLEIINASYNFADQEGTYELTLSQFRRLVHEVLPRAYMSSLDSRRVIDNIYKVFTGAAA